MRKALIVGINHYRTLPRLYGCVKDAYSVATCLERNADGTVNFPTPRIMVSDNAASAISRTALKEAVREVFADDADIALFYFSGHGHIEATGGYLCGSDTAVGDDGLALSEVMTLANSSRARNKIIILDSCHSGIAGSVEGNELTAALGEGTTILTASTADQYAIEEKGSGVFTNLLVDALNGAAANLIGKVTPGSVYAHIDQSLGPWAQRPVFKTNVKTFVSLRETTPPLALADLQAIATHFPTQAHQLRLDPSFEPERTAEQEADPDLPAPDPANTATFKVLQAYVRVNLVRPVDAPHMWHAAMLSRACELTVLGQHYQQLAAAKLI